jgi:hypothetical protein
VRGTVTRGRASGGAPAAPRVQSFPRAVAAAVSGRNRARNPRFEPGVGVDPRFWQIGGGVGGGPPIPGKSGIGVGWTPDCRRTRAEQLHLVGSRMSPCLASVAVITRGRRVRRRHNDIRFRFRMHCMLMLSAGLMLQCQLTLLASEEELARRGVHVEGSTVAEDRVTDADSDRRLFWR